VVIEPGTVHFHAKDPPAQLFPPRLLLDPGREDRPGIQKLAQVIERMG